MEDRLKAHLRAELPNFMQPKYIQFVDSFPRNPNGKIDRVTLRRGSLLEPVAAQ